MHFVFSVCVCVCGGGEVGRISGLKTGARLRVPVLCAAPSRYDHTKTRKIVILFRMKGNPASGWEEVETRDWECNGIGALRVAC